MDYKEEYLKLTNDAGILLDGLFASYVAHLICNKGNLRFTYHEREFNCQTGNGLICIPGQFTEVEASDNLEVRIVLTHIDFHYMATPQSNYGVQGTLCLFLNPVIELDKEEWRLLNQDIDQIEYRLSHTQHFRMDVLQCATQMLFLDYFQPHIRVAEDSQLTPQIATAMMRFINLLSTGAFIKHRDVAWYANELCVTAKYLSEISMKASGTSALFWIQRFTTTEIHRRLKNRNIPISEIIDDFNFSSPSHFTRYVQQHLGRKPTDFRF